MCFHGYKINNGSLNGLTNLQKHVIMIIGNEQMKWAETNKAIPSFSVGWKMAEKEITVKVSTEVDDSNVRDLEDLLMM